MGRRGVTLPQWQDGKEVGSQDYPEPSSRATGIKRSDGRELDGEASGKNSLGVQIWMGAKERES